jgi:hypothetical protein
MDNRFLNNIFSSYEPELSSDDLFIRRLEYKLDTIKLLKDQNVAMRRRCRRAIVAAATAGFVVGLIFSLAMPYIIHAFMSLKAYMPDSSLLTALADNCRYTIWPLICATSLFIAVNTYEISLALQRRHLSDGRKR